MSAADVTSSLLETTVSKPTGSLSLTAGNWDIHACLKSSSTCQEAASALKTQFLAADTITRNKLHMQSFIWMAEFEFPGCRIHTQSYLYCPIQTQQETLNSFQQAWLNREGKSLDLPV